MKRATKRPPVVKPQVAFEALEIPVAAIRPSKGNPRSEFGALDELAASIAEVGVLQPIVVKRHGGKNSYEIIAGERRWRAAKDLKLKTIPAVVRGPQSAQDQLSVAVVENVQREDLTPMEEARAYQQMIDALGMTQEQIADRVHKSPAHISKRLALTALPGKVQQLVSARNIGAGDAYELSRLVAVPFGAKLIDEVLDDVADGYRGNITSNVAEQLEKHERQQARDLTADKLAQDGATLLNREKLQRGNYVRVMKPGDAYGTALGIDVKAHQTEPCRGVTVDTVYGSTKPQITEYCISPDRHGPKGKSQLKAEKKPRNANTKSAQEQERTRAERDAAKNRHAFMRRLVNGTDDDTHAAPLVPAPVITLLALRRYARSGWSVEAKAACQLLGLEPITQRHNDRYKDWPGSIAKFLKDADEPTLVRVALAKVLAEGEAHVHRTADVDEHRRFLLDVGYEPTDYERTAWANRLADTELIAAHEAARVIADDIHNRLQDLDRHDEQFEILDEELRDGTTLERAVVIRSELAVVLAEIAAAEIGAEMTARACRVCGCTEEEACEGGCEWVDDPEQLGDLCSQCAAALEHDAPERAADEAPDAMTLDAGALDTDALVENVADVATVAAEPCPYPQCRLMAEHDEPHDLTPLLTDYQFPPINRHETFLREDLAKLEPTVPAVIVLQQELYAGVVIQRIAPMMKEVKALAATHAKAF